MRLLKALVFIDTQISGLNMWNGWVYFRNEVKSRKVQPTAVLVSTAIWDRGYICIGHQDSQCASSPGREAEVPGSAAKYPTPGYKPRGLPSMGNAALNRISSVTTTNEAFVEMPGRLLQLLSWEHPQREWQQRWHLCALLGKWKLPWTSDLFIVLGSKVGVY